MLQAIYVSMRYLTIILVTLCWGQCVCQSLYEERLFQRVDQIKKMEFYDNGVVVKIDSVEYQDLSLPYWNPNETYYQDDLARYKYCLYRALPDSTKGHRPDTARIDWALIRSPHPYLFLRDTAKMKDLRRLMSDEHPYVRVYAFGAMSFRKDDNLFSFIVDNLGIQLKYLNTRVTQG
jgi:hypothetical protein